MSTEQLPMASTEAPCRVLLLGDGAFSRNKPRELRYMMGGPVAVQTAHFVLDTATGYVHKHRWRSMPDPVAVERLGESDDDDLEAVAGLRAALAEVYRNTPPGLFYDNWHFNRRLAEIHRKQRSE